MALLQGCSHCVEKRGGLFHTNNTFLHLKNALWSVPTGGFMIIRGSSFSCGRSNNSSIMYLYIFMYGTVWYGIVWNGTRS